MAMINNLYYSFKPLIPRRIQICFRRILAQQKKRKQRNIWPIDESACTVPMGWSGWPENKKFALVLNHDVDTQKGHDNAFELLKIEKSLGFKSTFSFVPERYRISKELLKKIKEEGFEVSVHGLKHDGKLFKTRNIFKKRARKINRYLKEWKSEGFTAPSMICELGWIHDLNIKSSTCTFDTDPFEPVPTPSKTIFPFSVKSPKTGDTFLEMPYTLPQDHALFIILQERNITIWKEKLKWIAQKGGMALLNTHPDYMAINAYHCGNEEYPVSYYVDFLKHLSHEYQGQFWLTLPSEMAQKIGTCFLHPKIVKPMIGCQSQRQRSMLCKAKVGR